jgi:hypothetical protein
MAGIPNAWQMNTPNDERGPHFPPPAATQLKSLYGTCEERRQTWLTIPTAFSPFLKLGFQVLSASRPQARSALDAHEETTCVSSQMVSLSKLGNSSLLAYALQKCMYRSRTLLCFFA